MSTPAVLSLLGGDVQPTMLPMAAAPSYTRTMPVPTWALITLAVILGLYLTAILALFLFGRRSKARALAGFIPDCIVLFRRLLGDSRVPRSRKLALLALLVYLALPIDLIPDFIPVAGQADDAILAALVLRFVLRGASPALLREHWPGPPEGLRVLVSITFGAQANAALASHTA